MAVAVHRCEPEAVSDSVNTADVARCDTEVYCRYVREHQL